MNLNTQLIKQILFAIKENFDGSTALLQSSLGISSFSIEDTFFHIEALYKKGYVSFFKHFITPDHRHTSFVGGLTEKGGTLISQIKNMDTWEKEISNEIPDILKQNFGYYLPPYVDGSLWRYMSIDKLESLLTQSSLYFCRSDLLGDPFEGSTSIPTIKNRPIFYEGATKHFIEKGIPDMQKRFGQCTYISCWHFNTNESALMWRSYGIDNKAISIRTTIRKIEDSIISSDKEFILSPIYYVDYSKDYISEASCFMPYIHKQKQYEGEREFRIITDNREIINDIFKKKAIPPEGLFIDVDIKSLIQSIVISPFSNKDFRSIVK